VNPPEESRGSFTSSYQVAVLTPTAKEAIDYLKKIAASDISLSNNLAAARRADCVIRWLGDAVKPFEPLLTQSPESPEARNLEPLLIQARDEVVALLKDRESLQSSLMQELNSRQSARQTLETEIQTTRRDELNRRMGTGA
jgi:lysyl-tRNA synthetase class I